MATPREMGLVLKLLVPLCLFTLCSQPLMPSVVPETLTSLFWHHCQLGSQCSWYT
ncbi:hypothetical protein Golob_004991 [Gossypium lobatum]|uniref:Uncharacterized protein n=1 Tax=Gossypium lobatum TaxID=34289 RepID=A0A7J8N3I7_9ROSI|nr:hypothetical protein [Gossypium lobatum]